MGDIRVPFLDLSRHDRALLPELSAAFSRVLQGGRFVLGPEVSAFEEEFASFCGARHAVGVASGTDAIVLVLRALGIAPGDEVVTPALSAPPTAVAVSLAGGRPLFVDIDPATRCIDPSQVERSIGPRTRFLLAVHLYGRLAETEELSRIADGHGLVLVEDCAQAHGARRNGRSAGTWGRAGCYSFYPTKNLGAYGDGGAVITDDAQLARRLRELRDYGRVDRDRIAEVGTNSRLDELQAAFLRVKLGRLEEWNRRRRDLARRYWEELEGLPLDLPEWDGMEDHCFHLWVAACEERDALRAWLAEEGIETAVHYPVPLHLQAPYLEGGKPAFSCPEAERFCARAISLPLHPSLSEDEQDAVISAVKGFFRRRRKTA
ncbi:MAG: DegT/DnrJ/EryC1/StrS family aminotransferase [Actinobacteria bacterium]|nr:DegT/DnrJ/EryC1/StrS family aminotransferase [Actinomycetota bacterium]